MHNFGDDFLYVSVFYTTAAINCYTQLPRGRMKRCIPSSVRRPSVRSLRFTGNWKAVEAFYSPSRGYAIRWCDVTWYLTRSLDNFCSSVKAKWDHNFHHLDVSGPRLSWWPSILSETFYRTLDPAGRPDSATALYVDGYQYLVRWLRPRPLCVTRNTCSAAMSDDSAMCVRLPVCQMPILCRNG